MFVITLITDADAQRPDVDDRLAHRLEHVSMLGEDGLVASRDHGDLARGRLVDAAGDGAFERPDAPGRRDPSEALELVRVVRAHLDPRPARPQALEHTVGAVDHLAARRRATAGT